MHFVPERLKTLRNSMNISKAEAARRLNMSAMGYGRYERGEREPSYQTVSFIAQTFGSTVDYLYGISDKAESDSITVNAENEYDLFILIRSLKSDPEFQKRILAYAKHLQDQDSL